MSIQKFNIQVWDHIKASILDLNREELETRFWNLYSEMTNLPLHEHSIYWDKELEYIKNILK